MPGAAGGPGRALPCRVCPLPLPAAGSKVPGEGRAGGGRRRRQELPQGSAPLHCHPSGALAGFGPPAAPRYGAWWVLPWGHSPFLSSTTAAQPRGHSPSPMGTVCPRPWRPHPCTHGDRGHSTTRSTVPHPWAVSLCPWGLMGTQSLSHEGHSPRPCARGPSPPQHSPPAPLALGVPQCPQRCSAGPQPCGAILRTRVAAATLRPARASCSQNPGHLACRTARTLPGRGVPVPEPGKG